MISDVNDVSGSQGVFATKMGQILVGPSNGKGGIADRHEHDHGRTSGDGGDAGIVRDGHSTGDPNLESAEHNNRGPQITAHRTPRQRWERQPASSPAWKWKLRRLIRFFISRSTDATKRDQHTQDDRSQHAKRGGRSFQLSAISGMAVHKTYATAATHSVLATSSLTCLLGDNLDNKLGPAVVAMQNSALCSQALGPFSAARKCLLTAVTCAR